MSLPLTRARVLALLLAAAVFVADQLSKSAMLGLSAQGELPRQILPFFSLVLVKNTGISFGLFAHLPAAAPLAFTSALALALFVWLLRAKDAASTLGLGAIVGGALGNILDRLRLGAVTDFLDFHLGELHWPAFNIADSAVFIGVVILILIGIVHHDEKHDA